MPSLNTFFQLKGRLSRHGYWLTSILIWLLFVSTTVAFTPLMGKVIVIFNIVTIVALLAASVRRLHDRDLSGWWLLLILLPVLGALWLLWQLACLKGVADSNQWGKNPSDHTVDFLVVR